MSLTFQLILERAQRRIELALEIAAGECVALLGPNGAGKSSVLAGIAGLVRPKAGRVTLFGEVLFDAERGIARPPGMRPLGVMLQRPGLFAHLDVAHNVAFGLHDAVWSAPTAAIERAREALDALGLGHLAARAPSTLSGGEAQKVALLRMLVRSPRAWLLDEPLTGLDLVARRELLVLLGELAARERDTTAPAPRLVVVHDPRDALALASRWVVMDEGRVVAHGPPTKLARVAPSAYVDALLVEVGELTAHHEPAINGVVPAARAAQPATPAAPPSAGRGDP